MVVAPALAGISCEDLYSTSRGSDFDGRVNRMWQVFGTAEGGTVPSQGNEAGWDSDHHKCYHRRSGP